MCSVPTMNGRVLAINLAPADGAPMVAVEQVEAVAGRGLVGDRHFGRTRQVTAVCRGELETAATELGVDRIAGIATRRNLELDLGSLPRTHGTRIRVGDVVLAVWRDCAPCEVMETSVGPGARAALAGRAGISATVETGGVIAVGDPVRIG